jgi:hypothetical protein
MIVVDANVVSELMKAAPESAVVGWLNAIPGATMFLLAVPQAERAGGVEGSLRLLIGRWQWG